jgi:hypothetical protein
MCGRQRQYVCGEHTSVVERRGMSAFIYMPFEALSGASLARLYACLDEFILHMKIHGPLSPWSQGFFLAASFRTFGRGLAAPAFSWEGGWACESRNARMHERQPRARRGEEMPASSLRIRLAERRSMPQNSGSMEVRGGDCASGPAPHISSLPIKSLALGPFIPTIIVSWRTVVWRGPHHEQLSATHPLSLPPEHSSRSRLTLGLGDGAINRVPGG